MILTIVELLRLTDSIGLGGSLGGCPAPLPLPFGLSGEISLAVPEGFLTRGLEAIITPS